MSDTAAPAPSAAPADSAAPAAEGAPDTATTTPASPAKKPVPQFRKIKVGDEELSLSDEDIARDYRKWKGADAKFREAAAAKQSVDAFMKALAEDPETVLNDPKLPIDRKKLAEKWLVKQLEAELNPPDPRDEKLSAAEKRLKEYEDREAAEKQTKEQAEYQKAVDTRKVAISETLNKAMEATHLSAHPESAAATLREMAVYMRAAVERGEEVSPEELVAHLHNSRFQQMYSLAGQFQGEELIEFLGEEIVGRIRKADLARLRAGRNQGQQHKTDEAPSRDRRQVPRMDAITARQHAKKLMG